jgi:hypothetical protein
LKNMTSIQVLILQITFKKLMFLSMLFINIT